MFRGQWKNPVAHCLTKTPKSASYSTVVVRLLFIGENLAASRVCSRIK